MEAWFKIKSTDVLEIIEKRKNCWPWGNYSDKKYKCLIFRKKGRILITVDEFYKENDNRYSCCSFYTAEIAETIDEYNNMTEEEFVAKAYNTWMSGAR